MDKMLDLPSGPSCDRMAVGVYNDLVILDFPVPVKFVALDAQTAGAAGIEMARCGHAASQHGMVMGNDRPAIEVIRKRCVEKITHLIRSELINGDNLDKPEYIAHMAVEIMLTEVA